MLQREEIDLNRKDIELRALRAQVARENGACRFELPDQRIPSSQASAIVHAWGEAAFVVSSKIVMYLLVHKDDRLASARGRGLQSWWKDFSSFAVGTLQLDSNDRASSEVCEKNETLRAREPNLFIDLLRFFNGNESCL